MVLSRLMFCGYVLENLTCALIVLSYLLLYITLLLVDGFCSTDCHKYWLASFIVQGTDALILHKILFDGDIINVEHQKFWKNYMVVDVYIQIDGQISILEK